MTIIYLINHSTSKLFNEVTLVAKTIYHKLLKIIAKCKLCAVFRNFLGWETGKRK